MCPEKLNSFLAILLYTNRNVADGAQRWSRVVTKAKQTMWHKELLHPLDTRMDGVIPPRADDAAAVVRQPQRLIQKGARFLEVIFAKP